MCQSITIHWEDAALPEAASSQWNLLNLLRLENGTSFLGSIYNTWCQRSFLNPSYYFISTKHISFLLFSCLSKKEKKMVLLHPSSTTSWLMGGGQQWQRLSLKAWWSRLPPHGPLPGRRPQSIQTRLVRTCETAPLWNPPFVFFFFFYSHVCSLFPRFTDPVCSGDNFDAENVPNCIIFRQGNAHKNKSYCVFSSGV